MFASVGSGSSKQKVRKVGATVEPTTYAGDSGGFRNYLHDLADDLFPFPGYHQYQDEILYETLEAYLLDNYKNVVVEGPTGIGKSAINVTVPHVFGEISDRYSEIESHFGVKLPQINDGSAFYTTPQKSLRDQLAGDQDLQEYVAMLKSRRDYICGASGESCDECPIQKDPDNSCRSTSDCTYWGNKETAMNGQIAAITFAMLIVDNYLPPEDEEGGKLSFGHRDFVIVDEGHNSEGQSASLFAGYKLSPWSLPPEVYGDLGDQVNEDDDRFEDVEGIALEIAKRCDEYITKHENDEIYEAEVKQCESIVQKLRYTIQTHDNGRGWVVNVDPVAVRNGTGSTQSIEIKPIRVHEFLNDFVWSRGSRRLITSATIPFRKNVDKWGKRIGIPGDIKFISKATPFPEAHRLIHTNTVVGPMTARTEEQNWPAAMDQIRKIASKHEGEKGLIHSVSYSRAEKVAESLGKDNVLVEPQELDTSVVIDHWQDSDKDILVSPTMTEGVDLYEDRCRWQVLLKVPYAFMGDSRVSYLVQEKNEWDWYMEEAMIDIIQSVGRAVRGPEPEEAASFYVIDEKFMDVLKRTSPPQYFVDAVKSEPPLHWLRPDAAPWR